MKKIFLWLIYLGFVGILIFGAIYRFSVKAQGNDNSTQAINTDHNWQTLEGIVTSANRQSLSIRVEDGSKITIGRRAWRYAVENSFIPKNGDLLSLNGFYENGEFEVALFTNTGSGDMLRIRDKDGAPLWSGNK